MDALQAYVLPIRGLQTGRHQYDFLVDDDFFAAFPDSPVKHGRLELEIMLDRRLRELVLDFNFTGSLQTDCDRCLTSLDLAIQGEEQLLVKITSDPDQQSSDPEMIYLYEEESFLQLAPFVYEFILLAMPMVKTCEDAVTEAECDADMLAKLGSLEQTETEETEKTNSSSPWDVLKDWNKP